MTLFLVASKLCWGRKDFGLEKGFFPVPISRRSKGPVHQGWERLEMTIDLAPQYFNANGRTSACSSERDTGAPT
jgi:hypothetical protein